MLKIRRRRWIVLILSAVALILVAVAIRVLVLPGSPAAVARTQVLVDGEPAGRVEKAELSGEQRRALRDVDGLNLTTGVPVDISLDGGIPSTDVEISRRYDEPLPEGVTSTLAYYDDDLGAWHAVASELSSDRTEVRATVTHLSLWTDFVDWGSETVTDAAVWASHAVGSILDVRIAQPECRAGHPDWVESVVVIEDHDDNPLRFCTGHDENWPELLVVKGNVNRGYGFTATFPHSTSWTYNSTFEGVDVTGILNAIGDPGSTAFEFAQAILEEGVLVGPGQELSFGLSGAIAADFADEPVLQFESPTPIEYLTWEVAELVGADLSLRANGFISAVIGMSACSGAWLDADDATGVANAASECLQAMDSTVAQQLALVLEERGVENAGMVAGKIVGKISIYLALLGPAYGSAWYALDSTLSDGARTVTLTVDSDAAAASASEQIPNYSEASPDFSLQTDNVALTDGGAFGSDETWIASFDSVLAHERVEEGSWGDPDGEFAWYLYSPYSANPVLIQPSVEDNKLVYGESISVQQKAGSPAKVAYVNQQKVKASGFTAASWQLELFTFDALGDTRNQVVLEHPSRQALAHTSNADYLYSAGALDGSTLVLVGDFNDRDEVFAVDVRSGRTLWAKECGDAASYPISGGTGVVAFGCADDILGVNVKTGSVLWSVADGEDPHLGLTWGHEGIDGQIGAASGDWIAVSGSGNNAQGLLDLSTGVAHWGDEATIDPESQLGVVIGEKGGLNVYDLGTGKVVYSLGKKQISKLGGLKVEGAYSGNLWIWTGDGLDVVDALTGTRNEDLAPVKTDGYQHSKNVPIAAGRTWVYLATTNGYGDTTPAVLVRDPYGVDVVDLPATEITGLSLD